MVTWLTHYRLVASKMQNNNYYQSGGQYQQFDPELQPGNNMAPYGAPNNDMFAAMNGYAGPPQMGQYHAQQGYSQQMPNMGGQQYNGYANPQQYSPQPFAQPTYGPSHMATYGNSNSGVTNRRPTMNIMPVMDIGMPPLAVKVFSERDEGGRPVPPMFLTAPNHDAGVVNISHVSHLQI
jgi:hypothetical protein